MRKRTVISDEDSSEDYSEPEDVISFTSDGDDTVE